MTSALRKFSPEFLKVIDESARKCFGHLPVVNHRTGTKYIRRKPIGPIVADHYIDEIGLTRPFRKYNEDFATEEEERSEAKLARLKRRGKGPPKKGQGRRSSRKK